MCSCVLCVSTLPLPAFESRRNRRPSYPLTPRKSAPFIILFTIILVPSQFGPPSKYTDPEFRSASQIHRPLSPLQRPTISFCPNLILSPGGGGTSKTVIYTEREFGTFSSDPSFLFPFCIHPRVCPKREIRFRSLMSFNSSFPFVFVGL